MNAVQIINHHYHSKQNFHPYSVLVQPD